MTGDAFCRNCDWFNYVRLTGYSKPSDDGGTDWQVSPNQHCIFCGLELKWLHEPNQNHLLINVKEFEYVAKRNGSGHLP